MRLATYHAHTDLCDGKDSAEAMVLGAAELGMTDIGLTAHAMYPVASEWHLPIQKYDEYVDEGWRLKTVYADRIKVSLGFEADWFPGLSAPTRARYAPFSPDFLVGSVHYLAPADRRAATGPFSVDGPIDVVARGLEECFGGSGRRAATAYWGAVREMVESCDFDVVGHLDLARKHNARLGLFDESARWYRAEARACARSIARSGKVVEVNTGAIARGTMDDLYPSGWLLSVLARLGVPITVSSDAHSVSGLMAAYDRARAALAAAGIGETYWLSEKGWVGEPL